MLVCTALFILLQIEEKSEDDPRYCMCSQRCYTNMKLCELHAVDEHERQPVAHITTWGLSSARESNAETPRLMCSRSMGNNENIAGVPGNQFSVCFLIVMKRTDAMNSVP